MSEEAQSTKGEINWATVREKVADKAERDEKKMERKSNGIRSDDGVLGYPLCVRSSDTHCGFI